MRLWPCPVSQGVCLELLCGPLRLPGTPAAFSFLCTLQWENHNKSLQLEAQTYQRIHEKIQERVMNNLGTWIDWQYLQNAAKLLAKVCNLTLPVPGSVPGLVRFRPLRMGGSVGGKGIQHMCSPACFCLWVHISLGCAH